MPQLDCVFSFGLLPEPVIKDSTHQYSKNVLTDGGNALTTNTGYPGGTFMTNRHTAILVNPLIAFFCKLSVWNHKIHNSYSAVTRNPKCLGASLSGMPRRHRSTDRAPPHPTLQREDHDGHSSTAPSAVTSSMPPSMMAPVAYGAVAGSIDERNTLSCHQKMACEQWITAIRKRVSTTSSSPTSSIDLHKKTPPSINNAGKLNHSSS